MKFITNRPGLFLFLGFLILVIPEILGVYFIMPFPGSQHGNKVELAYNINKYIWVSRFLGGMLFLAAAFTLLQAARLWMKVATASLMLLALLVVGLVNFVVKADKMFVQPEVKNMLPVATNQVEDERIVLGVEINGATAAYPIKFISYHHQVRDTIGGQPIIVTYCSVCRTGRVYKPEVDGKPETFRLVGMDQYNAMFEDATTKSWWRQVNGECCAGPLKGKHLPEILCTQSTLASWKLAHPQTLVMQADPNAENRYLGLATYDVGKGIEDLPAKGGPNGQEGVRYSWVAWVQSNGAEKMYYWKDLKKERVIHDMVGKEPVVLILEDDNQSFHAFSRLVGDSVIEVSYNPVKRLIFDNNNNRSWNLNGEFVPVDGGNKVAAVNLKPLPAYQEYYHSFTTFHPQAQVHSH